MNRFIQKSNDRVNKEMPSTTMTSSSKTAAFVALLLFFLFGPISTNAQEDTCLETNVCGSGDANLEPTKVSRFEQDIPKNALHISANGNHVGWIVRVPRQEDGSILPCHLYKVKQIVAQEIVAEYEYEKEAVREVDLRGPYRLVDEEGKAFPTETTSNRLHLLLPREAFIHEAVEEGFVRTLSDGTKLTTLSLEPRVFLVDKILSKRDCKALIDIGSKTLIKSQEKHYSDDDMYKNYRTSWTGTTPQNSRLTRKLWERVKFLSAMPDGGVERPQLLKYNTNTSWYKEHWDFYHNFENRPLEEVRLFVQTRAKELLRLNVSTEITEILKDGSVIEAYDPIQGNMSNELAATLLKAINMAASNRVSPHVMLHHLLHISSEHPIEEFAIQSIFLAALMLRDNGAKQPRVLAERYFQLEGVENDDKTLPNYDVQDYVPYVVKPIQSNRHVTVLPILQAADRGGNTAFPLAVSSRMGIDPDEDEEFEECKKGLIVKAETVRFCVDF